MSVPAEYLFQGSAERPASSRKLSSGFYCSECNRSWLLEDTDKISGGLCCGQRVVESHNLEIASDGSENSKPEFIANDPTDFSDSSSSAAAPDNLNDLASVSATSDEPSTRMLSNPAKQARSKQDDNPKEMAQEKEEIDIVVKGILIDQKCREQLKAALEIISANIRTVNKIEDLFGKAGAQPLRDLYDEHVKALLQEKDDMLAVIDCIYDIATEAGIATPAGSAERPAVAASSRDEADAHSDFHVPENSIVADLRRQVLRFEALSFALQQRS